MKHILRTEFTSLPKHVNWFPGHMRKAMVDLQDELKKADLFLEVRDARIPYTSYNEELISLLPPRVKRLVVFNKIDLANESKTMAIIKQIKEKEPKLETIHISTKGNVNMAKLLSFISNNVTA